MEISIPFQEEKQAAQRAQKAKISRCTLSLSEQKNRAKAKGKKS